jgi:GT2 family glycosyltransferase
MDALAGVVVVHYGDTAPTARSLASILADPSGVNRLVALVDNLGNIDPGSLPSEVYLMTRRDNPGFGVAANLGVAEIDGDHQCGLYVVLNNDVVIAPGFLAAAVDALEVGVGAAGGPILTADDPPRLWYGGGGLNFVTGTVRQTRSSAVAGRRHDVGFIPATAMALSPAAWREISGFDPRFFLYNEDVDLCLRLRRGGWRLIFEPGLACTHRVGGATGSAERSPLYLENLTRTRLRPFRPRAYRIYLAAVHTIYNALRVAALGLHHGPRSGPYVRAVVTAHTRALAEVVASR